MKIIKNNAVYIQKKDLEFLKYNPHILPQSISSKIFENGDIDPVNRTFLDLTMKKILPFFKVLIG